uniref:Pentatricopeptide repeat-containing protein At3g28660 n=1 Tax=Rhizophora mucronata TaxID=61149 RepID=A0A2P2QTJ4_RHIMU
MIQILHGGAATSRSVQAWKRCMYLAGRCKTMRQVKALHGTFIVHGIHKNNYAISKVLALIALSNNGGLSYASLLFNQIETPNSNIYNTLIRAYSRSSKPQLAIDYFHFMVKDGNLRPDKYTFHFVLVACANACWVCLGKQIQNWVVKNGLVLVDGHVQTGIVRLYVQCGLMDDARKSFDEISQPDVVQWNVLINGYVRCRLVRDALGVFRDMLVLGFEPDEFCVTTALAACTQSGALMQGKWIHEYVEKRKCMQLDVFVGTALVDMYAKCGCIDMAVEVFEGMPRRNVFSWAAMIGGFAVHGNAGKAIHCLERMQVEDGLRPDGVVLLGVLMACTHAGLQEEGQFLLENMEAKYGVAPRHEHYSCMVDLLCRAGQLKEAILLINKMPMKPLASVWGAVLSSCRTHKNVEVAELAVWELLQLENGNESEEDAAFVQLANIYFSSKRSEDACKIRGMISDRKLKKTPGCSMIEVDGTVNEFVSGDATHRHITQIYGMLELLFADLNRLVSP